MIARGCTFVLANGRPCRATPQRDSALCVFHDPGRAEEVADARRLGGLRRKRERTIVGAYELGGLNDAEGIRRILEIAAIDALGLDNSIPRARVLVAIVDAGVRLLGSRELEDRILALEMAKKAERQRPFKAATPTDRGEPRLPESDE